MNPAQILAPEAPEPEPEPFADHAGCTWSTVMGRARCDDHGVPIQPMEVGAYVECMVILAEGRMRQKFTPTNSLDSFVRWLERRLASRKG
jgi:hypothetical protein